MINLVAYSVIELEDLLQVIPTELARRRGPHLSEDLRRWRVVYGCGVFYIYARSAKEAVENMERGTALSATEDWS